MPRAVLAAALCALLGTLAGSARSESSSDLLRVLGAPHPPPWWGPGQGLADTPPWLGPGQGQDDPPGEYDYQGSEEDGQVADKRSAVGAALHAGRRRRQPAPALGVLNDVGLFFDSLRDNLQTLASLSPQQRARFFLDPPSVISAPVRNGGVGFHKLQAFRPLRPPGSTKSYNRRSYEEVDGVYPAANRHDPGLLWTGLGR